MDACVFDITGLQVRPFIWVLLDGWTDDERDVVFIAFIALHSASADTDTRQGLLWSTLIHSVQKREDWKILEMAIARTPQQWNKQKVHLVCFLERTELMWWLSVRLWVYHESVV